MKGSSNGRAKDGMNPLPQANSTLPKGSTRSGAATNGQELLTRVAEERRIRNREDAIEKITWTSLGGIGTETTSLTGSSHLIEITRRTGENIRILLDCGMFQGKGAEMNPNLAFNPSDIHHTILTHAHLDHAGRLPLITKEDGEYLGEIHCTPITWDSALLNLLDTTKIAEDKYDEKFRKYTTLVRKLQEAERIVKSADSKGLIRNRRSGDRLQGTGELDPSIGEGQGGSKIKNRVRGGAAIHDLPKAKVDEARDLLAEFGLYDKSKSSFMKVKIRDKVKAPEKNLYTVKEVDKLELFVRTHKYDERFELESGITATFYNAGHIPGSAMVILEFKLNDTETYNVMFSGDLGRLHGTFHPYGKPKLPIAKPIDAFIHETTYGGKLHMEREMAIEDLGTVLNEAYLKHKKAVIIPAFAIERCAAILHHVIELKKERYFEGDILLDSPLGEKQTKLAAKHTEDENFSNNLTDTGAYQVIDGNDRDGLAERSGFRVIITGSGMANGGPVLDYLKRFSNDDQYEFAFVGYQSAGTTGERLTKNFKSITVEGTKLEVRAKIHGLSGFSAHADERDLYDVMEYSKRSKKYGARHEVAKLLLVHGEHDSSTPAFQHYLERRAKEGKRGIPKPENIHMPNLNQEIVLWQDTGTSRDTDGILGVGEAG